ncbi:MAG TPA: tRNA uridine(34) 5-carboxymethylaminomethyl modification radical SAM/GNAT enzyme Elp3 [Candidatus Nanoarchaeia archaeon]|nr:tRNA uridine(34) 5-carboxymethylaminomethyl modification radical SAM/GNAT enzyme Elp3 [Candidatus Nanoarchaeia archaeon]
MFHEELIQQLPKIKTQDELTRAKLKLSHKYHLKQVPMNMEILCHLSQQQMEKYKKLFITKPTRTISGVAPVAIMTAPLSCPAQAKCTFCPGGPNSYYGDTPKSYPGGSPAHLRAERNKYDPYLQTMNRLEHYALLNQDFSKTEVIIMGGTFTSYPLRYRHEFIMYMLKAMNDFADMFCTPTFNVLKFREFFELPADVKDVERTKRIHEKLLKFKEETNLEKEQLRNEKSNIRCPVLCIETRPDCSLPVHIDDILKLGGTRVEIGVQSLDDAILKKVERGHDNQATIDATQRLRDALLKVGYHMMLGLPGSTKESDIATFKELFENPAYKPDALKIYPCLVFKGTKIYQQWKNKEFQPINAHEAAARIIELKKYVPPYCRIMRVQRDIPNYMVEAGVEKTNLRQEILELMQKKKIICRCIRCREPKTMEIDWKNVKMRRYEYEAAQGKEIFLSFDDVRNDKILGFTRLRIPYKPYRLEITNKTAGIREIHVYGAAVKVGEKAKKKVQHHGIGLQLMKKAERVAKEEFDCDKMVVIAGIGAREYFKKKLEYKQDGPYVSKKMK